jgi:glycosyltransferase involved in cell wall biosynthesis
VWDHAIDALVVDKRRDLLHGALAVRGLPVALVSRFMYPGWAAPTDPLTRLAYRRVDLTAFLSDNAVPYAARGVSLHLPGTVSHEMLAGAYAAATIFAHPSTMEAFGIAVAEAMACECPVVAADAGSLPEVVGNAGVIVPPDDAAALSGALRDLLREPARRRTLGETGRKRVLERFGLARMQAAHLAALRAAVAHRRSRD